MDNAGLYLSYEELIGELYFGGSTRVSASDLTLSAKTTDVAGDTFEHSGSPAPAVGDVVYQAGNVALIIELLTTPNRIRINKTGAANKIANGVVKLLKSATVPQAVGEELIKEAMDFIDEETGQFFNKRSGSFRIEGNNTPILFFPVPIIEITKLIINSTDLELLEGEDKDFYAFKGRARPTDDRRNPRIKLNVGRGRDSIFTGAITNRVFAKHTLTQIDGAFGFLEADGSTPRLIKKAIKILAIQNLNTSIVSSASSSGTGPVKRIKVDLHEKEFFEPTSNKEAGSSIVSGSEEVDEIIAKFRTPIRIDGSFMPSPSDTANLEG